MVDTSVNAERIKNNNSTETDIFNQENKNLVRVTEALEDIEANKLRMVQINDYYSKRYDAETNMVKKIIIILVVFFLLSMLSYKKILPKQL